MLAAKKKNRYNAYLKATENGFVIKVVDTVTGFESLIKLTSGTVSHSKEVIKMNSCQQILRPIMTKIYQENVKEIKPAKTIISSNLMANIIFNNIRPFLRELRPNVTGFHVFEEGNLKNNVKKSIIFVANTKLAKESGVNFNIPGRLMNLSYCYNDRGKMRFKGETVIKPLTIVVGDYVVNLNICTDLTCTNKEDSETQTDKITISEEHGTQTETISIVKPGLTVRYEDDLSSTNNFSTTVSAGDSKRDEGQRPDFNIISQVSNTRSINNDSSPLTLRLDIPSKICDKTEFTRCQIIGDREINISSGIKPDLERSLHSLLRDGNSRGENTLASKSLTKLCTYDDNNDKETCENKSKLSSEDIELYSEESSHNTEQKKNNSLELSIETENMHYGSIEDSLKTIAFENYNPTDDQNQNTISKENKYFEHTANAQLKNSDINSKDTTATEKLNEKLIFFKTEHIKSSNIENHLNDRENKTKITMKLDHEKISNGRQEDFISHEESDTTKVSNYDREKKYDQTNIINENEGLKEQKMTFTKKLDHQMKSHNKTTKDFIHELENTIAFNSKCSINDKDNEKNYLQLDTIYINKSLSLKGKDSGSSYDSYNSHTEMYGHSNGLTKSRSNTDTIKGIYKEEEQNGKVHNINDIKSDDDLAQKSIKSISSAMFNGGSINYLKPDNSSDQKGKTVNRQKVSLSEIKNQLNEASVSLSHLYSVIEYIEIFTGIYGKENYEEKKSVSKSDTELNNSQNKFTLKLATDTKDDSKELLNTSNTGTCNPQGKMIEHETIHTDCCLFDPEIEDGKPFKLQSPTQKNIKYSDEKRNRDKTVKINKHINNTGEPTVALNFKQLKDITKIAPSDGKIQSIYVNDQPPNNYSSIHDITDSQSSIKESFIDILRDISRTLKRTKEQLTQTVTNNNTYLSSVLETDTKEFSGPDEQDTTNNSVIKNSVFFKSIGKKFFSSEKKQVKPIDNSKSESKISMTKYNKSKKDKKIKQFYRNKYFHNNSTVSLTVGNSKSNKITEEFKKKSKSYIEIHKNESSKEFMKTSTLIPEEITLKSPDTIDKNQTFPVSLKRTFIISKSDLKGKMCNVTVNKGNLRLSSSEKSINVTDSGKYSFDKLIEASEFRKKFSKDTENICALNYKESCSSERIIKIPTSNISLVTSSVYTEPSCSSTISITNHYSPINILEHKSNETDMNKLAQLTPKSSIDSKCVQGELSTAKIYGQKIKQKIANWKNTIKRSKTKTLNMEQTMEINDSENTKLNMTKKHIIVPEAKYFYISTVDSTYKEENIGNKVTRDIERSTKIMTKSALLHGSKQKNKSFAMEKPLKPYKKWLKRSKNCILYNTDEGVESRNYNRNIQRKESKKKVTFNNSLSYI